MAQEAILDSRPPRRPWIVRPGRRNGTQPNKETLEEDQIGPLPPTSNSEEAYFVIMEVNPGFQLGPNALQRIYVRSQTSGMVPLSELVTQQTTVSPLSVNHQGQFPSVTISFNLKENAPLGPAVSAIQRQMEALHVPPTISASFQGNAQAFQSSLSSTPILILAALMAVYIILGMLYENLI